MILSSVVVEIVLFPLHLPTNEVIIISQKRKLYSSFAQVNIYGKQTTGTSSRVFKPFSYSSNRFYESTSVFSPSICLYVSYKLTTLSASSWFDSSIRRALQWYPRGHGKLQCCSSMFSLRNYFPNAPGYVHNYISLNMLFYNTALHSDLVEGIIFTIWCFR